MRLKRSLSAVLVVLSLGAGVVGDLVAGASILAFSVGTGLVVTACGPATNTATNVPKTTAGGQVSYQAGRALEAVHAVQQLVANLEAQKVIPTARAGQFMIEAYKAGQAGEKLADLAKAYDTAVGSAGQQASIAQQMDSFLKVITDAFPNTPLTGNESQIGQLIQNVLTAVQQVRIAIPELRTVMAPPAKP